jgi:hypothetical protein
MSSELRVPTVRENCEGQKLDHAAKEELFQNIVWNFLL